MRIVKFDKKYVDDMAKLFTESFSEKDIKHTWSVDVAKKNLETYYKYFGDYCFMALDNNECSGAIFCLTNPYYKGTMLLVVTIIVKKKYRKKGVAKVLFERIIEKCKQDKMLGIKLMANSREKFPCSWYKDMGFKKSGWIEYELFI